MAIGIPLADPQALLDELRAVVTPYPERLRDALVANAWQAEFLLDAARKGAARDDTAYVALCCATASMVCAHAWHAVAGVWVTNEKDLVPGVARLGLETGGFTEGIDSALSQLGSNPHALLDTIDRLRATIRSTLERLPHPSLG